jgi:hypothetical protein
MDERFRETYAAIYDSITRETADEAFAVLPGAVPGGSIRDYIETASDELGPLRLREDAKAFLAVNFQGLVAVPLLNGGVPLSLVQSEIRRDIALLAGSASDAIGPVPDSEISAHQVINGLTRNWERLKTLRHGLWENPS